MKRQKLSLKRFYAVIALFWAFILILSITALRPVKENVSYSMSFTSVIPFLRSSPIKNIKDGIAHTILATPDAACFTYEELSDGTLRITGYDENKNTKNPYQVIIPASLDGKPVSVLGAESLRSEDSLAWDLIELTISDGITTLEANLLENVYEPYLINIPDSVTFIDKKAFQKKGNNLHIVIACNDTSYAYQFALENGFACQVKNAVRSENLFLNEYGRSQTLDLPYYCHYRIEGSMYDYIVMEYLDIEMEKRLQGELIYTDRNEFCILVLNKTSHEVSQCIDASMQEAERTSFYLLSGVDYTNFLSFADWNFDGIEDMELYLGYFGTGAASFSALFIYDADIKSYVNMPGFTGIDTPRIREDKQCIYGYSRGGAALHYVNRYEYIDGKLTKTAQLTQEVLSGDAVEITDERLTNGEWQIYCQETFYPRDMSLEEPYLDAYEQAEYLYMNDGYWDL